MNIATSVRFYTGSYNKVGSPAPKPEGEGIGIFQFDIEKGDVAVSGYLNHKNPSYLCISPDSKYLFAVEELSEGKGAKVFSYSISPMGALSLVDSKDIDGAYACHLAIIKSHLIIANYLSGDAQVFEILEGGLLSNCKQIIANHGTGPNKTRQEAAHIHMVYPWEYDSFFLVDLTLDVAHSYYFDKTKDRFVKNEKFSLKIDAGSGARHMVMNKDKSLAFVLGELTGEIFVFQRGGSGFNIVQKISIMFDKNLIPSGAAIKIHPNGSFLYASDRTSNMITVFKIKKRRAPLALVAYTDTGGKSPRDFSFDPTGNWLIAANQDSDNLVVFSVNKESGLLSRHSIVDVKTPVNVCFQHPV